MKYIFSIALVLALAYSMYLPVEEAKPPVVKQVKQDQFAKEWDELFRRAEFMTGFGVR